MSFIKYFWDLNKTESMQTGRILRDPSHPRFPQRIVTLLSRCDQPKELFSILPRQTFVTSWPSIRSYWIKRQRQSPQRAWWETLYEQMVEKAPAKRKGGPSLTFQKLGDTIKGKRVELGLSQKQLAYQTGLSQPIISQLEDGKRNVTLFTLAKVCKVLGIQSLDIS